VRAQAIDRREIYSRSSLGIGRIGQARYWLSEDVHGGVILGFI
jgi:hypothetical protein